MIRYGDRIACRWLGEWDTLVGTVIGVESNKIMVRFDRGNIWRFNPYNHSVQWKKLEEESK